MKIKTVLPTSSSSPRRIFLQRSRRIKTAADKSLALAVGSSSKRAWSRAILWKIQYKAKAIRRHRPYSFRRICGSNNRPNIGNKRFNDKKKRKKKKRHDDEEEEIGEADQLRELVPGGEGMDLCSLLDETAHYLKCLIAQVQCFYKLKQESSSSSTPADR
ncbi:transcription factor IBH1-like [Melia azedarach]|uniref:Transcription factor IBH1-like n=1 Tax=Melia azedarach TaxID=155640 RepID=A0ACC1Z4P2_MELAZ|nr:transcription factor IBH1-like [Melia azedarach]